MISGGCFVAHKIGRRQRRRGRENAVLIASGAKKFILLRRELNSVSPMSQRDRHIIGYPPPQGLYDPAFEHDSCGVGFLCHMKGKESHQVVDQALEMLERMAHRGACGCEPDSGDGAGIMMKLPDKFLRREMGKKGIALPPFGQYGVAMVFLPKDMVSRRHCEAVVEKTIKDNGMTVIAWRDVPTDSKFVGGAAKRAEPKIRQVFIG